jgi:flagellin-like hook-associated protein FlgL
MASGIILSAGVRQNLLSLQNTAALMATTQNRLATGKKVNSALDNPSNFFTSQSLSDRASDLNALLDSIGQAQQTLKAADNGITSLTALVQSAKSIATQALQATKGTVNYTNITGTVAINADTTKVSATGNLSTVGNVTVGATTNFSAAAVGEMQAGDTLTLTIGATNHTFTVGANNAAAGTFADAGGLVAAINHANGFGGQGAGVAVAALDGSGGVDFTALDLTAATSHALGGGHITAGNVTDAATQYGDALTISTGLISQTFYRVAAGYQLAAANTYSDATTLGTDIGTLGGPVTTAVVGNGLDVMRADGGSLTFSGDMAVAAGYASSNSGQTYTGNYNAQLAGLSGSITVQVGTNTAHSITFGTGAGQVSTRAGLNTALAALTDITGSVDSTGHVNLAPTSSDQIAIGGGAANLVALGLSSGITTPTGTVVTPNETRANLQIQYNDLLTQIDQLARDASYNGVNLLNGDNLKVVFNENGSSSMTIAGVKFNSIGLGLTAISGTGFQDNAIINTTLTTINTSLTSLRGQASKFGSNLTTVQVRQDFTKNMINTLQTGSDNLVLADTNEEGANMLALQTRQQLSTTALSLANQANQAVLRLFG